MTLWCPGSAYLRIVAGHSGNGLRISVYQRVWPCAYAVSGVARVRDPSPPAPGRVPSSVRPGLPRYVVTFCSPGQGATDWTTELPDQASRAPESHIYAGQTHSGDNHCPLGDTHCPLGVLTCDNAKRSMRS